MENEDRYATYVFDEDVVRKNIREIKAAFEERYPNFLLSYSLKTNYIKRIQEVVKEEGGFAEVVSPFEYDYAKQLFNGDHIIYNGPIPSKRKYDALKDGAIVNVDNLEELKRLIAKSNEDEHSHACGIGLRVTFDMGNKVMSRFGIPVDSDEFEEAVNAIRKSSYLWLAGFHCHISNGRSLKYWAAKAQRMAALASDYPEVTYIDLGGGLFGKMPEELSEQFGEYVDDFNDYAEAIGAIMIGYFPDMRVQLIIEPGTAIVGNSMEIEAHVTSIKRNGTKKFITVDCSSADLGFVAEARNIPVTVIPTGEGRQYKLTDAIIVGNTCLEYDYIRERFSGTVAVGDTLRFANVGAYSNNIARRFITPRLKIIDPKGKIIQPPETARDMFVF